MKIVKDTPDIETRRLLLKQVCIEDAPDIYAYTLNPNVLRYTTGRPPKAFSETESFVRGLVGKPAGDFAWAIRPKTGSAVIGVVELDIRERRSASLDYALAERYWNQGIMTEAVRALLDWAFRTYPTLESLHSSALKPPPASSRNAACSSKGPKPRPGRSSTNRSNLPSTAYQEPNGLGPLIPRGGVDLPRRICCCWVKQALDMSPC